MPYMIFNNVRTDKEYKTVFNGLVMTFNYSNAGILPTIECIKSDLKNTAFTDCFMKNNEPMTDELKNKLFLTVSDLNTSDYVTLTTVLSVLGLL